MEMKKVFIALTMTASVLSGCGEKTPVRTVDWYKEHNVERTEMVAKCVTSPGELLASPNCINAKSAANHLSVEKRGYPKLTPINPLSGGN